MFNQSQYIQLMIQVSEPTIRFLITSKDLVSKRNEIQILFFA